MESEPIGIICSAGPLTAGVPLRPIFWFVLFRGDGFVVKVMIYVV